MLREGLDIPECALVAILDADKEGYLRSKTSLIQTIGRAARNIDGRVILYADKITQSINYAISETKRRRDKQNLYNLENNITPESIRKNISSIMENIFEKADRVNIDIKDDQTNGDNVINFEKMIKKLTKQMKLAASNLEFEEAARIRDKIKSLEAKHLELSTFQINE